jgi:hypothetical protein
MAEHAEGPCLGLDSGLPRDSTDQMPRNNLEDLVEGDIVGSGWRFLFCFHTPTEWQGFKAGASPFFIKIQKILWDACA